MPHMKRRRPASATPRQRRKLRRRALEERELAEVERIIRKEARAVEPVEPEAVLCDGCGEKITVEPWEFGRYTTHPNTRCADAAERAVSTAPERVRRPQGDRPRSMNPDLDVLVQQAWDAGWEVRRGGSGHLQLFPPGGGRPLSASCTTKGPRVVQNLRAALRREGLKLA